MGRNGEGIKEDAARAVQKFFESSTVFMHNAQHMVTTVIAQADGSKIHRLNIHDHGNSQGGWFGKDYITTDNFPAYAPYLAKLFPYFTNNAKIVLGHCEIGQNKDLLRMFALTFGKTVYAGTGLDAGTPYNFNTGDYVGCRPSGMIFQEMRRP
jgi:hypothetical protein